MKPHCCLFWHMNECMAVVCMCVRTSKGSCLHVQFSTCFTSTLNFENNAPKRERKRSGSQFRENCKLFRTPQMFKDELEKSFSNRFRALKMESAFFFSLALSLFTNWINTKLCQLMYRAFVYFLGLASAQVVSWASKHYVCLSNGKLFSNSKCRNESCSFCVMHSKIPTTSTLHCVNNPLRKDFVMKLSTSSFMLSWPFVLPFALFQRAINVNLFKLWKKSE
jgi:hypothetical protein